MSKFKQRGWIGSAIDEAITRLIIIGVLVGAGATLLLVVVPPWIWTWIKPLIHGWTA